MADLATADRQEQTRLLIRCKEAREAAEMGVEVELAVVAALAAIVQ